jgi:hypothetical protein
VIDAVEGGMSRLAGACETAPGGLAWQGPSHGMKQTATGQVARPHIYADADCIEFAGRLTARAHQMNPTRDVEPASSRLLATS